MDIINWKNWGEKSAEYKSLYSCTIGVFDGVHLGHQHLIQKILQQKDTKSMVVTFRENPVRILSPEIFQGNLTTLKEKLKLLSDMKVHVVLLIDFSHDFSTLSCRDFLDALISRKNISYIALGENFRCGQNAETDIEGVKEILAEKEGVHLDVIQHLKYSKKIISSTRIRKTILAGDVKEASKMLGRPYSFTLPNWVEKENSQVTVIDKNTLKKVLPPPGKYKVRYKKNGEDATGSVLISNREIIIKELPLTGEGNLEFLRPSTSTGPC